MRRGGVGVVEVVEVVEVEVEVGWFLGGQGGWLGWDFCPIAKRHAHRVGG